MPGKNVKARPSQQFCGALLPQGGTCPRPAGFATDHPGTGHCRRHGGKIRTHAKKISSELMRDLLGDPGEVDPSEQLLYCVALASQELGWVRQRMAEVTEPTHLTPMGNLGGPSKGWVGMQEEFDIWIQAHQNAIDRLARYSRMALDAGVAERLVSLAERMGDLITPLLSGVLEDLQLTPAQKQSAPKIIERHMLQLEARTGEAAA